MIDRFNLRDDYSISRVINGCWQLSTGHSFTDLDIDDVIKGFNILVSEGFTTFDVADIYAPAEEILGRFFAQVKNKTGISPEDIQIHTKFVPDLDILETIDFKYTERIIDRSLKRLNREALDLVQFHWWDYDIDRDLEVADGLVKLMKKGKIKNIGVTNYDSKHLKKLVDGSIPIVSCQSQYSIMDRRVEKGLLDYCKENDIGMICYGTLAGGLLADRFIGKTGDINPENRSHVKYLQVIEETIGYEGYKKLLELLKEIAEKYKVQVSHVANKYILEKEGVAAAMIGVRNSKHAKDNSKIFSFELTSEEKNIIRDFLKDYKNLEGEAFELERKDGSKFKNIMKMNLNEN